MSAFTIDLATARAVCAARREQTRAAKAALLALEREARALGGIYPYMHATEKRRTAEERRLRTATKWARVRLVNGTTAEGVINCDVLKEWLRLGAGRAEIAVLPRGEGVKLRRLNSAIIADEGRR